MTRVCICLCAVCLAPSVVRTRASLDYEGLPIYMYYIGVAPNEIAIIVTQAIIGLTWRATAPPTGRASPRPYLLRIAYPSSICLG